MQSQECKKGKEYVSNIFNLNNMLLWKVGTKSTKVCIHSKCKWEVIQLTLIKYLFSNGNQFCLMGVNSAAHF